LVTLKRSSKIWSKPSKASHTMSLALLGASRRTLSTVFDAAA
jgi:hypothetical protein